MATTVPGKKRRSKEPHEAVSDGSKKKRLYSRSTSRDRRGRTTERRNKRKKKQKDKERERRGRLKVRSISELAELVKSGQVQVPKGLDHYKKDRMQLLDQIFTILPPEDIKSMIPDILKDMKMKQIRELCYKQLVSMSEEQLDQAIRNIPSSSSSAAGPTSSHDSEERSDTSGQNDTHESTLETAQLSGGSESSKVSTGDRVQSLTSDDEIVINISDVSDESEEVDVRNESSDQERDLALNEECIETSLNLHIISSSRSDVPNADTSCSQQEVAGSKKRSEIRNDEEMKEDYSTSESVDKVVERGPPQRGKESRTSLARRKQGGHPLPPQESQIIPLRESRGPSSTPQEGQILPPQRKQGEQGGHPQPPQESQIILRQREQGGHPLPPQESQTLPPQRKQGGHPLPPQESQTLPPQRKHVPAQEGQALGGTVSELLEMELRKRALKAELRRTSTEAEGKVSGSQCDAEEDLNSRGEDGGGMRSDGGEEMEVCEDAIIVHPQWEDSAGEGEGEKEEELLPGGHLSGRGLEGNLGGEVTREGGGEVSNGGGGILGGGIFKAGDILEERLRERALQAMLAKKRNFN